MVNFTSNTYQMKREILSFSNKISRTLPKPERKFIADMNYGILASNSCLLTDIVDQLHEPSRKINIVDRLSRHLAKGIPKDALNCTKSCHYTDRRSGQRKNIILLLPAGKRYLRHTVVCKRRHQALVQDKASCIPSTLP